MTDDAVKARATEALSQAFLTFGHPHPARHIAQGRELTEDQPIYIAAMIAFATAETAIGARQWRCFHCGDVFTSEQSARLHFGRDEDSKPACVIKAGAEQGLLGALREAEYAAADARRAIADESTDAAQAYYAQATRHAAALRNAEEAGYERGLADARIPTDEAASGAGMAEFPREQIARLCLSHLFGFEYKGESLCDEAERIFSQPNPRAVKAVSLADEISNVLAKHFGEAA